jgi:Family of unknown function (DUF6069)
MDLPQAQETLMATPTTRPWRARALAVIAAVLAALAGWGLLALLERFTARPRTIWTAIAVLVGLLSLVGPLSTIASTTVANGLSLALMHLAVAAVLIPGLAATAPSLPRPAPAREQ